MQMKFGFCSNAANLTLRRFAGLQQHGRRYATRFTIHERICRHFTALWALLVAADIAIYVTPGAGRLCSETDDADKASSTQLRTAFIVILIVHIVLVCMWGGAWAGMIHVASWPESNIKKAELNNHTDTQTKESYRRFSYFQLAVGGFLTAWVTKAWGYGSLSNVPTEGCLHGTVRLAWFQLFLWLSNIVYLGGLVVLAVLGVVGALLLGWSVCRETVAMLRACCIRQTSSDVEVSVESKGLVPVPV